ncbi:MAG: hypothetical protein IID15_01190, partial [Candidatus Marinimicrobia bacterium]|nr:hypothetical protein [Candidatus Neomarinimicrobiota bacterium]
VSEVVAINDGFVIFKITGFEKEMIMTESGYSAKWLAVKKQLRSRQVDREARKYITAMMTTKNIIQRAAGFQEVSGYLEEQLRDNPSRSEENALGEMDETSFLPDFDLALPTVETPDFTWTGEDVLLLVRNYNYRLPANDPDALRSNLTGFLKGATRDHYLNERAMRRGIASNARVKNDTRMWTRHFLFRIGIRELWGQGADSSTVANKIARLRESAQIRVNQEVLEKIALTNIAVLAYWSTDIARHLAVPPLIDIQ